MYEDEYLNKLVSEGNLVTAKSLSNTFRYQDDCIALNDGDAFRQHYRKMYPAEMKIRTYPKQFVLSLICEYQYSEVNLGTVPMTNEKISISIFVTIHILMVIYHGVVHMVYSFHN